MSQDANAQQRKTAPAADANPLIAPLFSITRALLDEVARETQRWSDHGAAQAAEQARLVQVLREQLRAATESALDMTQRMAAEGYEIVAACMQPLTRRSAS